MSQKTLWQFFAKSTKTPLDDECKQTKSDDVSNHEKSDIDITTTTTPPLTTKIKKPRSKRLRISSSDEEDAEVTDSKTFGKLNNKKMCQKSSTQLNDNNKTPKNVNKKLDQTYQDKDNEITNKKSTPKQTKTKSNTKINKSFNSFVENSQNALVMDKDTNKKHHGNKTQNVMTKQEILSIKSADDSNEKHNDKTEIVKVKQEENPRKIPSPAFFTKKTNTKVEKAVNNNDYNPAKKNYHPINDAFWKHGEKVPYLALTRTFEIIEEISGRLRTIEVVANFLRSVIILSPDDLVACVYLCLNQLAPAYEGSELGVAETSLMKVIAQTTGRSLNQIKSDCKDTGDLGIVAERSKSNQRMMFTPSALTVNGVFMKLKEIARMSGHSAMGKKIDKIQGIFVSCRHSEARYFIRSLLGKLRIGLAEQSLLQAIAVACTLTPPNQCNEYPPKIVHQTFCNHAVLKQTIDDIALQIKTTYCQCPNYDKILRVLLENGVDELLDKCQMTPGTPLKPMLAHPTKGVQEVLQRFDGIKFTCEWKYDGERVQIHISDDNIVTIYSRNQENNTGKYPDIISRIELTKTNDIQSCILDCEAVAWDMEKKQILPFQILSTRKRKDANETDIKVKVCVFMFDLLYFNGRPLVTEPFIERRRLLRTHFREIDGIWQFATSLDTCDINEMQNFLDISVKGNCEGLMVKTLEKDATYEIAKRSRNWLKLKKDYLLGVCDSLDLVVIGGFKGKGKRTGTYGGFLLACYDIENEQFQSICKLGTGFSDDDLQKHTEFLKSHTITNAKSYYMYDAANEPDDWFEPVQLWEVLCADLSLSPVHKAAVGIVDSEKGISLRFPRFIRVRDDKSGEDATSAQQVADMYWNQDQIKNQDKPSKSLNEEDYY